ncbi:MAG: hypothetical protein OES18_20090, partial [Deltaproteobacteria bacterium]|nr:hypothetical protein [Deltaproteobacteria bacterium]
RLGVTTADALRLMPFSYLSWPDHGPRALAFLACLAFLEGIVHDQLAPGQGPSANAPRRTC